MTTDSITHSIDAPGKAREMDQDPDPEIPAKARRRQFSARYKAEVLATYDKLAKPERGALLRREGPVQLQHHRVAPPGRTRGAPRAGQAGWQTAG
jgi:hypothetical protein